MNRADPRRLKQGKRRVRRAALAVLRPRWSRCFWTWPLGHRYGLVSSGRLVCSYCGRPEILDGVDEYVMIAVVEQAYGKDVTDPLRDLYRADVLAVERGVA